jgi:hypothetical protein
LKPWPPVPGYLPSPLRGWPAALTPAMIGPSVRCVSAGPPHEQPTPEGGSLATAAGPGHRGSRVWDSRCLLLHPHRPLSHLPAPRHGGLWTGLPGSR